MSNIIPFDSQNLPAYLTGGSINTEITSNVGAGFPVISIKGKTFAIVRDGERTILPNPKDPDAPATNIDVVIVKANSALSKIYYIKKFEEGSDAKPDCYSSDGVAPASDAQIPQSKSCVTCQHNQWGARITDAGKKAKACQDNRRIAVTTPTNLDEPYLMRVPPASLKELAEYGQMCAKRGVDYYKMVTKISFDPEASTPHLLFKPVGFLDQEGVATVEEIRKSDIVAQILGMSEPFVPGDKPEEATTATAAAATAATAAAAIATAAAKKTTKAAAPAAPTAAAAFVAPTAAATGADLPAVNGTLEVDLVNLKFDD